MKKHLLRWLILCSFLLVPVWVISAQETSPATVEIGNVDDTDLPTVNIFTTVIDENAIPILGLGVDDFEVLLGDDALTVTQVENITSDELPISIVMVIDSSESMAGRPLMDTQAAAIGFLDNLEANDEVAIVDFDNEVRVVQNFTTDRDAARDAINGLQAGGRTALYDAGLNAVELALSTDNARRFVIFLTDGNEYGGASGNPADAALTLADDNNVPIYTIGLGYNIDERYLVNLANASGGELFVSPTSGELAEIYSFLSELLRSQYIVTVQAEIEPDGSTYDLTLNSEDGSDTVAYTVLDRYPQIVLRNVPTEAISEPVDVGVRIDAPRRLEAAGALVDGGTVAFEETIVELDFEAGIFESIVTLDPYAFTAGEHTLTATAGDQQGGIREETVTFEVASLPTIFSIGGVDEVVNTEALTIEAIIEQAQEAPASVAINLDGVEIANLTEAPYSTTVDVLALGEGSFTLEAIATTTDGQTTTETLEFATDPELFFDETTISIDGIGDGDIVNQESVDVSITVDGTPEIAEVTVTADDNTVATLTEAPYNATIDIIGLGEGDHTITVTATDTDGNETAESVAFSADPQLFFEPTTLTILGLDEDDVVDQESIELTIIADGTPEIADIAVSIDDELLTTLTEVPYTTDINILSLGEGDHTVTVTATDTDGNETSESVTFGTDTALFFMPPDIIITGIENNERITEAAVEVQIEVIGSSEVEAVTVGLDGEEIQVFNEEPYELTFDMVAIGSGTHTLVVSVADADGNTTTESIDFIVADNVGVIPTSVSITGLEDGDMVDSETVDISVDVEGSAIVDTVTVLVDGEAVETLDSVPYDATIDIVSLGEGDHTLSIEVLTTDGVTTSESIDFTADPALFATPDPTQTPEPLVVETEEPTPTNTDTPEPTATNTAEPSATNTPEPSPTFTVTPTATTPPEAVDVELGEEDSDGVNPLFIIIGIILLLLLLLFFFLSRRNNDEDERTT